MEHGIKAVLFDFDMTLVDSSYGITECVNRLAEEMGLRKVTRQEVLQGIGLPIEDAWIALWGKFDPKWLDFYRDNFRATEQSLLVKFDGVDEVVRGLRERGIRTGVVSNRRYASIVIKAAGLYDIMDVAVGLEDVSNAKPHPEPLEHAAAALGIAPADYVYVGDTDIDMACAKAALTRGIGVTTGNHTEEQLRGAGAWAVIKDIRELMPLIGL